jgi:Uma2 family endonuclease
MGETLPMISIDEMQTMLDGIAETFPEEFYTQLNGGIVLMPQAKRHQNRSTEGLYVLGEYYRGGNLGRYIAIYYGSFMRVHGHLPPEALKRELTATLKHEFRHHLESLAGERGLEIEDEKFLAEYLERQARRDLKE